MTGRRVDRAAPLPVGLMLAWAGLGAARGAELDIGVVTDYVYNSNFFGAPAAPFTDANLVQVGPSLDLRQRDGRLRYRLRYDGLVQRFTDQSEADALEHRLGADLTWALDRRTSLRLKERYRDVSNLRFTRLDIELGDTVLNPLQDRYQRNDVELELRRDLSRRSRLEVTASQQWIDFENSLDRSDSTSLSGAAALRHQLSRKQTVGVGIEAVRQAFEATPLRIGSDGTYARVEASWDWTPLRHVSVRASVGPAWVRSSPDLRSQAVAPTFVGVARDAGTLRASIESCAVDPLLQRRLASLCDPFSETAPPIVAPDLGPEATFELTDPFTGNDTQTVDVFGGIELRGEWPRWTVDASFRRRQSSTSGEALVSTLDRVFVEIARPTGAGASRLTPFLAMSLDRRRALADAPLLDFTVTGDAEGAARRDVAFVRLAEAVDDLDALTLIGGVTGALGPRLAVTGELRLRRTRRFDALGDDVTAEQVFASLSLSYGFAPIRW